jgi:NhaP-type Na+/H+ or K+/H+ antiporter
VSGAAFSCAGLQPRSRGARRLEHQILLLVAGVAVAGVVAQWFGWRFRVPSILALLAIGLLLGPVSGWVKPSRILGEVMSPAIGMAVAIIVFEGGLNLNLRELRTAGSGVIRLVFLALPLNWALGALAGHYIGHLAWSVSVLVGSILVVTGPTVIIPLLRQAKLEPRAGAFLKWEGIVNDPIGATLTLLILSFLVLLHGQGASLASGLALAGRAALGSGVAGALGVALPFALRSVFRRDLAPEYLKTPILLAGALGVYAVGEAIQSETGLVGATIFGVVLANIEITGLQELRRFKESLTVFLVSGLFILLTANIDPQVLRHLSWPVVGTAAAILFLVRPLAIVLATIGAQMSWRERLLVGWIGPRGVVAAAVAGLATEQLGAAGYRDAPLILPLVFSVIAATVILHGLSLAPLARALKLASDAPPGLLIVGSSPWTIALAETLRTLGVPTLITDPDWHALRPARHRGLQTSRVEILSAVGEHLVDLRDLAYLLAATDDDAYNALVCTRFAPELGRERVHQPPPAAEREQLQASREWRGKYVPHAALTHARLSELVGDGFGFRVRQPGEGDAQPPSDAGERWPVLWLGAGAQLTFASHEHEVEPGEGDVVIWFERLRAAAPARRRRWGRPRPERPRAVRVAA